MIEVKLKLYADRAKRTLSRLASRLKDMTPVWNGFIDYFQNDLMPASFNTTGRLMQGSRWAPLNPAYRIWKQRVFGPQPMLYATGKMADATMGGPGWYQKVERQRLEIGIDGEAYFYWVERNKNKPRFYFTTPSGDMPARAWKYLIDLTTEELESADDDR